MLKEQRGQFEYMLEQFDRLCALEEELDSKLSEAARRVDEKTLRLRYTWQTVTPDLPVGQWYVCRAGWEFEVLAFTMSGEWRDWKGAVKPTPRAVRWL